MNENLIKEDVPLPHRSPARLRISDFCDMKCFEKMMKDWAKSTGLATVAVGYDGQYISDCYNFTDFCQELTRKSPEGLRRCIECDKKGFGVYLCHAGLIDFAAPITLEDGTIFGSIIGGQVLPEKPDEEQFRATARELGVDEDAYIKALRKVNIRSSEETKASADLLESVINMFVRASYAARISAESLTERANIISSLGRIYFCYYYIDLDSDNFLELDAAEELHAYTKHGGTASELLAGSCRRFADPEYIDDFLVFTDLSTMRERLSGRQSISYEFICRDSGWCRAMFIAVKQDNAGNVSHVIYAVQRIQEEKEKELKTLRILKDAADEANRANHAKSDFLSRMSHDLRTPLNGIVGFTELALHADNLSSKQAYLSKIEVSSHLMLDLVNDILDMSKIISDKMILNAHFFNVKELLNEVITSIRLFAEKKNIAFYTSTFLKNPFIYGDKLRHQQILLNLLSNAVKYTLSGGTVWFTEEALDNEKYGCNVRIVIRDTGIGMCKDFQAHMFEAFSQEQRAEAGNVQGTGLGLTIVQQLVARMGGTIEVESESGIGTTITVYLPVQWSEQNEEEKKDTSFIPSALSGRHILLAEDNDVNAEITEAMLCESADIKVTRVADGLAAVHAFESSDFSYYDAILMDIRMPIMNGIEASGKIRALDRKDAKTIPIIALTADAFSEDIKECLAAMNAHVAKPVTSDELFLVLWEQIRHTKDCK